MDKIILAFSNEKISSKINYLLSANELEVFKITKGFNEMINYHSSLDNLIIISQLKFENGLLLDINNTWDKNNYFICISNEIDEDFIIKNNNSFILRIPLNTKIFINLINMILNINNTFKNSIDRTEKKIYIDKAKEILIKDLFFTEEDAHKFIQKKSMDKCIKRESLSKIICNSFDIY